MTDTSNNNALSALASKISAANIKTTTDFGTKTDNTTTQLNQVPRLPHDIDAEAVILGSIIINNMVISDIAEFLHSKHFYDLLHQKIYEAVLTLHDRGITVHHISLKQQLLHDPIYKTLNETNYLLQLTSIAAAVFNPLEYARIVYDLALRRELITVGNLIVNNAFTAGLDNTAQKQIEDAEAQLFCIATDDLDRGFVDLKSSIDNSIAHINISRNQHDGITGISSGFIDLDKILHGFHDSDLVILAARPGMGKTTLALNFAYNAAVALDDISSVKEGQAKIQKSVGIFSLEMQAEQLSTKLISMQSEIDSSKILSGRFSEADYNALRAAGNRLSQLSIFIDDTAALSITAIRTRARRLKRKHNLGILVIDYLQLIRPQKARDNRTLEISEITQGLKALAKELRIPIIALSQLSRAVEQRVDKRPLLSDLRESGSIEQDADVVMFIYRQEYYRSVNADIGQDNQSSSYVPNNYGANNDNRNSGSGMHSDNASQTTMQSDGLKSSEDNTAEIIISKHRNGRTGMVRLCFDPKHSSFHNGFVGADLHQY